jgi:hypothetical protein
MDVLRNVTENINVFVRFFQSINQLFCQIRWFEANVTRSTNPLAIIVVGIVCISLMIVYKDYLNMYLGTNGNFIQSTIPVVMVVGIVVYAFIRRSRGDDVYTSFNDILMGRNRNDQYNPQDIEVARPVATSNTSAVDTNSKIPIRPHRIKY